MVISRAVGQDRFQSEYVVRGDAVRQGVRTTRVFRDISADGAGLLAGRIGRVEISVALHGLRDLKIHDTRFQHRALVRQIDFDDGIHAGKGNYDSAGPRNHAAAQPGSRAPAHNRDAMQMRDANQFGRIFRRSWKRHQLRQSLVDAAIVLVELEVVRTIQVSARPEQLVDLLQCVRSNHCGRSSDKSLSNRSSTPKCLAQCLI